MIRCWVCERPIRWSEMINGWTHVGPFLSETHPMHAPEPIEEEATP